MSIQVDVLEARERQVAARFTCPDCGLRIDRPVERRVSTRASTDEQDALLGKAVTLPAAPLCVGHDDYAREMRLTEIV